MNSSLYQRIKLLCAKYNVTVTKLENDLGFGSSSIVKWNQGISPSVDKVVKIAQYFNVSTDYLLGRSSVESTTSDIFEDEDIITIQRGREKMPPSDKKKMMQMLKIVFDGFDDKNDEID